MTRYVSNMFVILLSIKKLWPMEDEGNIIFIQQDNPKSHVDKEDKESVGQPVKVNIIFN